jgi:hypothetical protein
MDPLKPSDLGAAKDWDAFQPDMRGYISPQQLDLWTSCRDVEVHMSATEPRALESSTDHRVLQDQIRQFTSTDYMRDNDAPFLALSVAKGFPATRLAIRGETFAVPISPRDIAFLATHLGGAGASRHTVSEVEVRIVLQR